MLLNLSVLGWITENLESENLATANLPFLGIKSTYWWAPGPGDSL